MFFLAAVICCIHLGANEYLSVQFLAFAATAVIAWPSYFRQLHRLSVVAAILLAVVATSYVVAHQEPAILMKGIRSIVALLVLSAWQLRLRDSPWDVAPLARRAILFACCASFALATVQFVDSIYLNTGWFNLPKSLYGIEYGTLASERYKLGILNRPSAMFSEPSALGALGVLAVAVSYSAKGNLLRVVGFAIVVISQSLSSLVLATGIALLSVKWKNRMAPVAVLTLVAIGATLFMMSSIGDRITQVLTATDLSARIRIFEPVLVLRDMFAAGEYFGASREHLMTLASRDVQTIFDNWFLNQFLLYGLLGAFWIALSLLSVRISLWPLLAAYMVTNGDALYYDRYFLLLMAMAAVSDVGSKRTDDFNRNRHLQ